MIGVYDYTVVLTYLSMMSGVIGTIVTMTGVGHPDIGVFFLMISGLLDAFDGRVARTKKGRTQLEKEFGVQIDSLSDLICFGVLPVAIGIGQLRVSGIFTELVPKREYEGNFWFLILLLLIAVIYVLTALIRLAYFNATQAEREEEMEATGKAYFRGLPVTASALIFPLVMMVHFYSRLDLTVNYFVVMLTVAFLFVFNIRIPKPGKIGLTIIIIIGLIEFIGNVHAFTMYIG